MVLSESVANDKKPKESVFIVFNFLQQQLVLFGIV